MGESYFRTGVRDDRETEIEFEVGIVHWGEAMTYDHPGCGPEVEILDVWLLSDADKADAPRLKLTDAEEDRLCTEFLEDPPEPPEWDYD